MVHFENNKIVVEIESRFPVEDWLTIYTSILQLTENVNEENITFDKFATGWFLKEFLPDVDTANKMHKK